MNRVAATFALLLPVVLIGCGDAAPDTSRQRDGDTEAPLPAPGTAGGDSVTGMPDEPGPNPAPAAALLEAGPPPADGALPAGPTAGDPLSVVAPPGATPATGATPDSAPPPVALEPTAADAVAVVRDYYAAIAAGDFARAHGLWGDGGRASGQSPRQFAAGFADVASLSFDLLEPGRVEPAAGSRYVEVPVAIDTVHHDGSRHRYVGAYTLRRSVVDGASAEQRAWRLHSADIREVRL